MGYSFRLTARVLLHVPSHRQDNTYTIRGARPITPWANTFTTELHLTPTIYHMKLHHERTPLPRSYISLPSWEQPILFVILTISLSVLNPSLRTSPAASSPSALRSLACTSMRSASACLARWLLSRCSSIWFSSCSDRTRTLESSASACCVNEGQRDMDIFLFNDALNTFYLRFYGVRHMVKDGRKCFI